MKKLLTARNIIIWAIIFLIGVLFSFHIGDNENRPAYDPVKFYNKSGQVFKPFKVFIDTFNVNNANGGAYDISAAGFTAITAMAATALRSTSTATSCPNVAIKAIATNSITLNLTEGSNTLINILGSNVLLGPSSGFASTSGLSIQVVILGY